jgi:hypothetical protein
MVALSLTFTFTAGERLELSRSRWREFKRRRLPPISAAEPHNDSTGERREPVASLDLPRRHQRPVRSRKQW